MPSNPSSTGARGGSARRYYACVFLSCHFFSLPSQNHLKFTLANRFRTSTPSSNPSTPNHDNTQSSSSFSSKSVEQRDLAAHRINEYVMNREHAHVQHRHASSQQAIRTHTNTMGAYLGAFDDSMNQGGD
jgi:hypothetical protein